MTIVMIALAVYAATWILLAITGRPTGSTVAAGTAMLGASASASGSAPAETVRQAA